MEEEEGFSPTEFLISIWRNKWLFLFVSSIVFIVGIVAILRIPAIYRSTGMILVEQQEIPTQWVNSTVASFADERIQAIGQRVLNTENLIKIIDKYNLYAEERSYVAIDQLVAKTRENFSIENVQASIRDRTTGARGSATVAFRVSFDNPDAQVAKDVTTELVSLYVDENVKSRTKAIVDTREFLESEANRLELSLAEIEEKISEFKERNVGVLPEHQEINLQTFQRVEQQISDIDRTLSSLNERKIILESGIDSARRFMSSNNRSSGTETTNPLQRRLNELQTEFSQMQTRYSEVHPDLIKIKREMSALEQQISGGGGVNGESSTVVSVSSEQGDASLVRLETDLRSAESEQSSLRLRREQLVSKLSELEEMINKAPEVEREYKTLVRDHEGIQTKYNDIRAKQNSARVSESLEVEQKGERFTLVEPPRLPITPHSPNRKKLSVVALGAAIIAGLGSILGLEKMQGRLWNARGLEKISNVPVLARIGYIENNADKIARRNRRLIWLILLLTLVAAIAITLNHFEFTLKDIKPEELKKHIDVLRQYANELVGQNG